MAVGVNVASLFVEIDANTKGLVSGFDQAERMIDGFNKKASGIGSVVTGAFKAATLTATAFGGAMAVAVGSGIAAATDFESAFTGVIKTVDATDEQLAELRQGILEMSSELPASASDIASVAEAAGQLGIQTENILGFTRVMSDLGVATNMSSTDAATALARLANITGMSQTDFDRLGSSIVALGNNLATTEGEIVEMGLRIAGAGAQIGMSEAQILGLAGALSSVGINAEAGGSAISRVLIDMASEVATGGEKLAGFANLAGMSAEGFAAAFREDAAGALVAFVKGLDHLSVSGGNVFGVLDELGLSEIRTRDALLRLSSAHELMGDAMQLSIGAWEENNALTKEAELRYSTTASRFQLFRNAIDAVRIGIGDKFLPVWSELLSRATDFVRKVGPSVIAFFGRIADGISDFVQRASKAWETLSSTFSLNMSIITSENATWGEKMVAIWDMLYVTSTKIWQSLLDRLIQLLPQWLDQLGKWALGLWEWIKEATPKALEKLGEWAGALWDWLVENLPTWIANLWEWAQAAWAWLVEATPVAIEKLGEWATALWDYLTTNLPVWWSAFTEWGRATWQWLQDAMPIAIGKMGEWVSGLMNYLTTNSPIWQAQLAEWGRAAWAWLADVIPEVVLQLMVWAERIFEIIGANLPSFIAMLLGWGKALVEWIGWAAPQAILALAEFVKGLRGEGDNTGANAIGQMVRGWAIKLWRWIIDDAIPQIAPAFKEFLDAVLAAGKAIWDALVVLASEWGLTVNYWLDQMGIDFLRWSDIAIGSVIAFTVMFWPAISAAFAVVITAIGTFVAAWAPILALFAGAIAAVALLRAAWENDWLGIRTTLTAAWEIITRVFDEMMARIRAIVDNFKIHWGILQDTNATLGQKLSLIWNALLVLARTVWEGIVTVVKELWPIFVDRVEKWGVASWEWLIAANEQVAKKIAEWGGKLLGWIQDNLPKWTENLTKWATAAWEWLVGATTDAVKQLGEWGRSLWKWLSTNAPTWIENLGKWGKAAWEWLVPATVTVLQKLTEWGQKLWNWLTANVSTWIDRLSQWTNAAWQWLVDALPPALQKLGEWGRALWDWMVQNAPIWAQQFQQWLVAAWQWLVDARAEAIIKIGEWGAALLQWLGSNLPTWIQTIFEWGTALVVWLIEAIPRAINNLTEFVRSLREEGSTNGLREFVDMALQWAKALWEWIIQDLIPAVVPAWAKFMQAMGQLGLEILHAMHELSAELGITLWTWIIQNTPKALEKLREWYAALARWIVDSLPDWIAQLGKWGIALWQWIVDATKEAVEKLGDFIKALIDVLVIGLDYWVGLFKDMGRDIIQGLIQGIQDKWDDIRRKVEDLARSLPDWMKKLLDIQSPSAVFAEIGSNMMAGLQQGINSATSGPLSAIASLATQVQGRVDTMVSGVQNSLNGIDWNTGGGGSSVGNSSGGSGVYIPPPIAQQNADIAYGTRTLGVGVQGVSGTGFFNKFNQFVEANISGFSNEFMRFASEITREISKFGLAPMGSAQDQAVTILQSGSVFDQKVDDVLSAIQLLIRTLSEKGLGNQFMIQERPDESLAAKQELIELVAYLNALYG